MWFDAATRSLAVFQSSPVNAFMIEICN
jgi:hypothetical protein